MFLSRCEAPKLKIDVVISDGICYLIRLGDFGVAPSLCLATFGKNLFSLLRRYGGSFDKYFIEIRRREKQFETHELDRYPDLGWPAQMREKIRQILGFFIGVQPFDPFAPSPGLATSPAPGMAVCRCGNRAALTASPASSRLCPTGQTSAGLAKSIRPAASRRHRDKMWAFPEITARSR